MMLYHPSSNGQIERHNRTFLQMIHYFVEKEHQIGDESLPILTSAIRSIVNRQTDYYTDEGYICDIQQPLKDLSKQVDAKKIGLPHTCEGRV